MKLILPYNPPPSPPPPRKKSMTERWGKFEYDDWNNGQKTK